MTHIVLDCPHCGAQQMTMTVHHRTITRDNLGIAYAQCGRCTHPVTALVRITAISSVSSIGAWATTGNDVINDVKAQVVKVLPAPIKSAAPSYVPDAAARVFVQAENARQRSDRDTAGMAFRKTLDIALKSFDGTLKGDLYKRIDALKSSHAITPAMNDWAHQVRLIGNDAAHEEEEPSEQDIEAIALFTETLLKYLFTLPAEVSSRIAATVTPEDAVSDET